MLLDWVQGDRFGYAFSSQSLDQFPFPVNDLGGQSFGKALQPIFNDYSAHTLILHLKASSATGTFCEDSLSPFCLILRTATAELNNRHIPYAVNWPYHTSITQRNPVFYLSFQTSGVWSESSGRQHSLSKICVTFLVRKDYGYPEGIFTCDTSVRIMSQLTIYWVPSIIFFLFVRILTVSY